MQVKESLNIKRTLIVFVTLSMMALGPHLLASFAYQLLEGASFRDAVALLITLAGVWIPLVYLIRLSGMRRPNCIVPLLACLLVGFYILKTPPFTREWYNLLLVDLIAAAVAAPLALYEKSWFAKKVEETKEAELKAAMSYLNRFKTSNNRQYIIAAHIDIMDVREELDGDNLIYLFPDGRYFIILKQPRKQSEFEELLANLRIYAPGHEKDVVGYIDNGDFHKSFGEGNTFVPPFDFSLLEKARYVF